MQFNLKDLREFLQCTKNQELQYIYIKNGHFELTISRELIKMLQCNSKYVNQPKIVINPKISVDKIKENHQIATPDLKEGRKNLETDRYYAIVSPMVGTFYSSPGPTDPTFVKLNQKVEAKQTVCIIEAMKLMNEIEAEISGEIVEILVQDGEIVDCGQALMKIKPE